MSAIGENIARIRAEIDAAARETGRTGKDITLVGASKMNDAAACQEAIAAGIDALGCIPFAAARPDWLIACVTPRMACCILWEPRSKPVLSSPVSMIIEPSAPFAIKFHLLPGENQTWIAGCPPPFAGRVFLRYSKD